MTPALAHLENPSAVPAAALSRLAATSAALQREATGVYAAFLASASVLAARSAVLLEAALAGTPDEAIANAERVAFAGARLFDEIARRSAGLARASAMRRAGLFRDWLNDTRLTLRAFPPPRRSIGAATAIRILPGAEPALETLSGDPLLVAQTWDPVDLAGRLARWVVVS